MKSPTWFATITKLRFVYLWLKFKNVQLLRSEKFNADIICISYKSSEKKKLQNVIMTSKFGFFNEEENTY